MGKKSVDIYSVQNVVKTFPMLPAHTERTNYRRPFEREKGQMAEETRSPAKNRIYIHPSQEKNGLRLGHFGYQKRKAVSSYSWIIERVKGYTRELTEHIARGVVLAGDELSFLCNIRIESDRRTKENDTDTHSKRCIKDGASRASGDGTPELGGALPNDLGEV